MMLLRPILSLFENWIDPFRRRGNIQPPRSTAGFIWFYIGQAKCALRRDARPRRHVGGD